MESITPAPLLPTGLDAIAIDEETWRDIRRLAGDAGAHPVVTGGLRTGNGTPVVVVLLERPEEHLPPVQTIRRGCRLTEREAEVALLLARRLSGHEIAAALGFTIHTARRHTEQVLSKLRVSNRTAVRGVLQRLAEEEARRAAA